MTPVLLINEEFMQLKQHHKYLLIMSDDRLKRGEFIDSVSNKTHKDLICSGKTVCTVTYKDLFPYYSVVVISVT